MRNQNWRTIATGVLGLTVLWVGAAVPANAAPKPETVAIQTDGEAELTVPSTAASTSGASEISSQIASDPNARYVSVTEATEMFGFDPNENAESTEPEISPFDSWGGCDYEGRADYPHVTNFEASVHGYWIKTGGTCPSTATVTVDLQALLCSSFGCTWVTQETDAGTFKPGSGTGRWATPHKDCASSSLVGWRGQVDVNLTDWADPYGYDYGAAKDLNCSPA